MQQDMDQAITNFCRQVRARSAEHQQSLEPLIASGSVGVAVGLLRQELDSLIRVAYLSDLGVSSPTALSLIEDSVAGDQWTTSTNRGRTRRITDREMVDLAAQIGGWVRIIYSFGCKLIYLSNFHDHATSDPFTKIDPATTHEISTYTSITTTQILISTPLASCNIFRRSCRNSLTMSYYVTEIETANAA